MLDTARPTEVMIVDVSPRDGLQNESRWVPTEQKIELVNRLARAGVPRIEVTSFVSPRAVPLMADAADVMRGIERRPGTEYCALVPNVRGFERALAADADVINVVVVATETFNRRNAGMSVDEGMAAASEIAARGRAAGVATTAILAAAFHCPFEGETPLARVLGLTERFVEAGFAEITLADTIGAANPGQVHDYLSAVREHWPEIRWGIHLHDTRGLGLANAYSAIQAGAERLEASVGGLGGCPFAPGASGNACSEDLAFMLESMGIRTGVDLDALLEVSRFAANAVDHPLTSRMLAVGPLITVPDTGI